MIPLLKYYSYHNAPNDEELKACIDIATKAKSVVLLYYADAELTNNTDVHHVFIHAEDTLETAKARMFSYYKLD